ncbi:hypothetical protein AVEN_258868-1 [Araneus ventricosus]|uniref:Uncharacterized protein n=1 Tax=Araneus ventricosus TaxID=182803 RepID=A0A4Y2UZQ6_ARAVE|nr:hypothetical protein AVEN_258868-1 [Araneus ventricosus]
MRRSCICYPSTRCVQHVCLHTGNLLTLLGRRPGIHVLSEDNAHCGARWHRRLDNVPSQAKCCHVVFTGILLRTLQEENRISGQLCSRHASVRLDRGNRSMGLCLLKSAQLDVNGAQLHFMSLQQATSKGEKLVAEVGRSVNP